MLKRFAAVFFVLLYTASVFGFALNLHYCGKVLTSVTIDTPAKRCGSLVESKMHCCKDKQVLIKVKDAHQSLVTSFEIKKLVAFISINAFSKYTITSPQRSLSGLPIKDPPDPPLITIPVFLINQSFRI